MLRSIAMSDPTDFSKYYMRLYHIQLSSFTVTYRDKQLHYSDSV